jgi:hypothetical protein
MLFFRSGALGVSRTLVVDPNEHPRVGSMQYPETLPLNDHEVVLTFDESRNATISCRFFSLACYPFLLQCERCTLSGENQ